MEIKVEDLQIGDEFLYSVQSAIARAKVIRPVQVKKVQPTYSHQQGKIYYKSVKCKVAIENKTYTTNWQGNIRSWTKKEYNASDNYTVEKFIDLNYRNIWLIKRED